MAEKMAVRMAEKMVEMWVVNLAGKTVG